MPSTSNMFRKPATSLRTPRAEDGAAIWNLVRDCKPLDENSMYCNLIQCDHFRDTCVVAELNGQIAGWISAYVVPSDETRTLFVWQVAVAPAARGDERVRGLARAATCLNRQGDRARLAVALERHGEPAGPLAAGELEVGGHHQVASAPADRVGGELALADRADPQRRPLGQALERLRGAELPARRERGERELGPVVDGERPHLVLQRAGLLEHARVDPPAGEQALEHPQRVFHAGGICNFFA